MTFKTLVNVLHTAGDLEVDIVNDDSNIKRVCYDDDSHLRDFYAYTITSLDIWITCLVVWFASALWSTGHQQL